MYTSKNNEGSTAVIIQPTGNLAPQQIFHVKKFKILGGVQIALGGILLILSIVDLTKDHHPFMVVKLLILLCSGWFIMTGCLPQCMPKNTEPSLKCQKTGFLVCSVIGAAVFVPIVISVSSISFWFWYRNFWLNVSFWIFVLSVVEAIVAIIVASYCCCCSPWETPDHQVSMQTQKPSELRYVLFNGPMTQLSSFGFRCLRI